MGTGIDGSPMWGPDKVGTIRVWGPAGSPKNMKTPEIMRDKVLAGVFFCDGLLILYAFYG